MEPGPILTLVASCIAYCLQCERSCCCNRIFFSCPNLLCFLRGVWCGIHGWHCRGLRHPSPPHCLDAAKRPCFLNIPFGFRCYETICQATGLLFSESTSITQEFPLSSYGEQFQISEAFTPLVSIATREDRVLAWSFFPDSVTVRPCPVRTCKNETKSMENESKTAFG